MAVQLHDYRFAGVIFQKKHEIIPHVLKNYFRKQNQANCFFDQYRPLRHYFFKI